MKSSLHQADPCCSAFIGTIHDGLHKLSANSTILNTRIDCDGADARDDGALIETVAARENAIHLSHDAIKRRV